MENDDFEELKLRLRDFAEARDDVHGCTSVAGGHGWPRATRDQFDVQEAQMSREHRDVRSDPVPDKKRMEL